MKELIKLLREVLESGKAVGEATAEKCPCCGQDMSIFRKHEFAGFNWTCDSCQISYPAAEK